ncbi:acyl-CoA carboxylase subunit epsilon [Streptomyces narbonensis]|uniref:Acyl-CoA carboxylase subunit epsilon n=1 Tax=Streptomyces narbonensis TaxID=67333 RepID=A0ABV3CLP7_9ACTN
MTTQTPTPALDAEHLFRVERGVPTDEEMAALAVVLLMRMSGTQDATEEQGPAPAHWRSLDRAHGHRAPRSWRSGVRRPEPGAGDPG